MLWLGDTPAAIETSTGGRVIYEKMRRSGRSGRAYRARGFVAGYHVAAAARWVAFIVWLCGDDHDGEGARDYERDGMVSEGISPSPPSTRAPS